ncbi:hypothetical protein HDV00_009054 [Rhizophlyctis rosea]|nr:hypothetical protein HDV00_009054 [Rhizophlyctis rosea]
MKHSPYHKVFEEDAIAWKDELDRVIVLFDMRIDGQRHWLVSLPFTTRPEDHLQPPQPKGFPDVVKVLIGQKRYQSRIVSVPVQHSVENDDVPTLQAFAEGKVMFRGASLLYAAERGMSRVVKVC